jgi:hypothetical protein
VPTSDSSRAATTSSWLEPFARTIAGTIWSGALTGFLVGGVGGRLAMRVLFLTSPASIAGVESDDGFIIGRFDLGNTLGLIVLGTGIGIIGALLYLLVRRWLPARPSARAAVFAAVAGVVVGNLLVHTDGIDFRVLEPTALAIALFVAIPALFGAVVVPAVEGWDRPESWFHTKPLWLALPPILLTLPLLIGVIAIPVLAIVAARAAADRSPRLLELWESRAMVWLGRAVFAALFVAGAVGLAQDAVVLL